MRKLTFFVTCLFASIFSCFAQETIITGTVYDDQGETAIGASIMVEGTTVGTVTDFDGNFSLAVPEGATHVVVSYVGFESQTLPIEPVMKINLKGDTQELEEVVVTGYQKIDRKMFTGAAAMVSGEDALVDGGSDVSRMLQGKTAGVQVTNVSSTFGAAPKLRVRGASSIYGNSNPLWVVDGVVLDDVVDVSADDLSSGNAETLISSAVAGLNPDDIESFQILKDASATALYGARAMNGVIVITTKRGRKGSSSINYTGEFTMRLKPSYREYDIMNSQDQMSVFQEMAAKGHLNPATMYLAQDGGVYNKMYQLIDQALPGGGYALANTAEARTAYLHDAELRNTDWFDELFRPSVQQRHAVSFSSGTEKSSTYASFSALLDPGWTYADKVNLYTFNMNTNHDITKWLNIGILGSASYRKQKAPGTLDQTTDVVTGEYTRDFDINPFSYALNSSRTMDAHETYRRNYAGFNIPDEIANNYIDLDMLDTKMQIDLSIKPVEGLELNALGSVRYVKTTREHKITDNSNMANAYRAYDNSTIIDSNNFLWSDPDNPDADPIVVMPQGGFYNTQDNTLLSMYGRASANYNKMFTNGDYSHAINFLAGAEIRSTDRMDRSNDGYGYLWATGVPVTDYRLMRKMLDSGDTYFTMTETFDRSVGFFATGTYSFNGTYTLNGTIRTEGSNQMGESPRSRWLPTWNISGSWNAKNEPFLQDVNAISNLTLRATYGLTAITGAYVNANAVYLAATTYRPFQDDREVYYYIDALENRDITWEKTKETNIGLDLGFVNGRINFSADVYWKNGYDLIGLMRNSGVGGQYLKYGNFADMKSNGFEFMINTLNIDRKDFSWSNMLTFSFNQNEITNLHTTNRIIDMVTGTGAPVEGYSSRSLFSIPFAGLDEDGFPTFWDKDGNRVHYINFQDRTNIEDYLKYEGTIDPKITGGFENTLKYKNFTFSLFFTYQFGSVLRLYESFDSEYSDIDAFTNDMKNRWVRPGDEKVTNVPVIPSALQLQQNSDLEVAYNAYNYSTERVAKGDFIRLKDVTLTYDFDRKLIEKAKLTKLQLKFVASNVWLIYSDKRLNGQDPEFTRSGGVALPTPHQFTLSIRAGF